MKKIINDQNHKNEIWFNWLTRKINSYEPFKEFALGQSPEDLAEDFIIRNKNAISEVFKEFDEEDKDILEQFQKLTECEWHVFRMLKFQMESRRKVRYVDFKKGKK